MELREFEKIKKEIEKDTQEMIKIQGAIHALENQIKKGFGVETIKEAEEIIKKYNYDIEKEEDKIKILEEKLKIILNALK